MAKDYTLSRALRTKSQRKMRLKEKMVRKRAASLISPTMTTTMMSSITGSISRRKRFKWRLKCNREINSRTYSDCEARPWKTPLSWWAQQSRASTYLTTHQRRLHLRLQARRLKGSRNSLVAPCTAWAWATISHSKMTKMTKKTKLRKSSELRWPNSWLNSRKSWHSRNYTRLRRLGSRKRSKASSIQQRKGSHSLQ